MNEPVKISIHGYTHFIVGLRKHGDPELPGVRFRPYTEEEFAVCELAEDGGPRLNDAQVERLEMSESEPGDVVIDLGSTELNEEFCDLLNKAIPIAHQKMKQAHNPCK
jgi:hypothetical protein